MFPRSFIFFGVLHGIAVMLVVGAADGGLGPRGCGSPARLAIGLLGAGAARRMPVAGARVPRTRGSFNWLGLVSRKPITEDYVPLFPWLGVMWWGMAAGQWLLRAPAVGAAGSRCRAAPRALRLAGALEPVAGTCCTSRC